MYKHGKFFQFSFSDVAIFKAQHKDKALKNQSSEA